MATIRGQKNGTNKSTKRRNQRKTRVRARRVRIGAPDPGLTPAAGVEAVREADRVLGITSALDDGIGLVKQRDRGVTGGELVVAMA